MHSSKMDELLKGRVAFFNVWKPFQDGGEVNSTSNLTFLKITLTEIFMHSLFQPQDQKNWGENRFLNSLKFSTGLPPGEKFYLTIDVCDLSLELKNLIF